MAADESIGAICGALAPLLVPAATDGTDAVHAHMVGKIAGAMKKCRATVAIVDSEYSIHAYLIDGRWVSSYVDEEFDLVDTMAFEDIAYAGASEWPPTATNGGQRWLGMWAVVS
jgi:hypothetical protein